MTHQSKQNTIRSSGNADKVIKLCNSLPSCSSILSKINVENNTVVAKSVTYESNSLLEFANDGANNVLVIEPDDFIEDFSMNDLHSIPSKFL